MNMCLQNLFFFHSDKFTRDNIELVLGDDKVVFDKQSDPTLNQDRCRRCLKRPKRVHHEPTPVSITTTTLDDFEDPIEGTDDPIEIEDSDRISRRSPDNMYVLFIFVFYFFILILTVTLVGFSLGLWKKI